MRAGEDGMQACEAGPGDGPPLRYLELTVPELLEDFNASEFAAETGASVSLQSPDGVRWNYHDAGGIHRMMSPQLAFFTDIIAPHFAGMSHSTVVRAIRQLVAWDKRPD